MVEGQDDGAIFEELFWGRIWRNLRKKLLQKGLGFRADLVQPQKESAPKPSYLYLHPK